MNLNADDKAVTSAVTEALRRRAKEYGDDFKLGPKGAGVRCFCPDKHQNGDSHPSAWYKRARTPFKRSLVFRLRVNTPRQIRATKGKKKGVQVFSPRIETMMNGWRFSVDVTTLLQRLLTLGVQMEVRDGTLRVAPRTELTEELVAHLCVQSSPAITPPTAIIAIPINEAK